MEKLLISPNFTIDDIHRIREYSYEITKNMPMEEKIKYYNNLGIEAENEIKHRKALKQKNY